METRSKATRDQALSEAVIPPAEFPARIGETTPASGDLGDIGAAGIVGDSRPSSTSPLTRVISPHMSVHEADVTGVDGPPLLQRADLAPTIDPSRNLSPPTLVPCELGERVQDRSQAPNVNLTSDNYIADVCADNMLASNPNFTVCDAGDAGFAFRNAGRGAALYNTAFRAPGFHDMAWDGPRSFRPISPSRESPPHRPRSRTSSRATSRASGVNMDWLGDFVRKFAADATDERKQAFEKVTSQEQQTLEFMQDMIRKQNDFALQRENQIRADMKQLAASEARVASLQQKLENRELMNVRGDSFIARERPYFPEITASYFTPVSVALPRVSTSVSLLTDTTVYHTLPSGAVSINTPTVSLSAARPRVPIFDVPQQQAVHNSTARNIFTPTTGHFAAGLAISAPISGQISTGTATQSQVGLSAAVTGQMTQPSNDSTVTFLTQSVSCTPTVTVVSSVVPASVSLSVPVSASVAPPMSASLPSPQPLIVVNTPQTVRPYNGSTTWTSFRDHFGRVAKVNRWQDDVTKAQHLMLALEGDAAEILKEISDTSPTVLQDIWDALSRRFGENDDARVYA